MTDDFQLFDQSSDDPVDSDIALITAYLARELSPVQIVAVEDRLASDAAFRNKVGPILNAWVLPPVLGAVHAGQGPLSRDEVESGWARYVGERAELDAHEGPHLIVESAQRKRRKISMTRIAAGVAAITLPVLALAQVMVYASKHPSVPGHSVAKDIVAPFVEPLPAPPPTTPPIRTPSTPVDVPVGRQLEKKEVEVQRAAPVQVPAVESLKRAASELIAAPIAKQQQGPRETIMGLVKQHMPEVVRGDTNVTYAVIVLDATDNYVWGTYAVGLVQLVIGGDKRTPAERADYSFKHVGEYTGMTRDSMASVSVYSTGRGGYALARIDSSTVARGGRVSGGGRGGSQAIGDSNVVRLRDTVGRIMLRLDSTRGMRAVAGGGGGGVARGGGGGRGGGVGGFSISGLDSGSYVISGGGRTRDGAPALNTAAGLQEPGGGESGIQGLKASSLTMGETYNFRPGELTPAPRGLRVFVVHLAPGTNWRGR